MIQLEFKLEQQTPLLHFQHTQQGATLRATEVKPRFDRWLVKKVWNNDFHSCKTFLVGYDPKKPDDLERKFNEGYRALNYKMRIEPGNDQSAQVAMTQNPAQPRGNPILHDLLGVQMETTSNYPSNTQSVIMSNIGGRLPEEVVNFSLYDYVDVLISVKDPDLAAVLKANFKDFVLSVNFGNRKSKGFGSFIVVDDPDEAIDPKGACCFVFMTISTRDGKSIRSLDPPDTTLVDIDNDELDEIDDDVVDPGKAYKDIFAIINKLWRMLKSHHRGPRTSNKSVLLGEADPALGNPARVPSPVIFKPIIVKYKGQWDVMIAVFYDFEVMEAACGHNAKSVYDRYMVQLQKKLDNMDIERLADNTGLNYMLDDLSIDF